MMEQKNGSFANVDDGTCELDYDKGEIKIINFFTKNYLANQRFGLRLKGVSIQNPDSVRHKAQVLVNLFDMEDFVIDSGKSEAWSPQSSNHIVVEVIPSSRVTSDDGV